MYSAKILKDSVGPTGARLVTFELTYPRFVHAELMTHRLMSRGSASSRAIPTSKMLSRISADPVMPVFWGKNEQGMQASEELSGEDRKMAEFLWLKMRNQAIDGVSALDALGLHKQLANRPVEAWMFITVILSATNFTNFDALRASKMAQPEFAWVAYEMRRLLHTSNPQVLVHGQWHLPLLDDVETLRAEGFTERELVKISTGRCARVSYLTHDGVRDPRADIALHDRILKPGHMGPFEHAAMALGSDEWRDIAGRMAKDWIERGVPVGNFWGFHQYRKQIANEHDFSIEHLEDAFEKCPYAVGVK